MKLSSEEFYRRMYQIGSLEAERLSATGPETALADGAIERDGAVVGGPLEHGLDPLIEARLADVVSRLRADWIIHIAGYWGDIHPIHKDALGQLDKRVATTLREGFFHFSQLLCGLELLLLKDQQVTVVLEHRVLSLEKLVVKLSDNRRHFVEIAHADGGLPELFGAADCGSKSSDK